MINQINKTVIEQFIDPNIESDSPFRKYLGYYEKDKILGYLIYDIIYDRAELVNIYVLENYRNNKIGTQLLQQLINIAKKNNCKNITLEVRKSNKYAILLYKKYNFKEVAIRKGYYSGEDGILMELIL